MLLSRVNIADSAGFVKNQPGHWKIQQVSNTWTHYSASQGYILSDIKRLVLDVLKPHNPSIIEISQKLADLKGVSGVNCTLDEVDQETESIKITMEGHAIDYESVKSAIRSFGAVIHSVDNVVAGKKLVDEVRTPQD
jgi:hypothetical protein